MSTPQSLKYNYRWAKLPVQRFTEKWERGTRNFAILSGYTVYEVKHYLTVSLARGNSLQFEAFKRAIKYLTDYDPTDLTVLTPAEGKLLHKYVVWLAQNDEIDERNRVEALDTLRQRRLSY